MKSILIFLLCAVVANADPMSKYTFPNISQFFWNYVTV